jgi:membrane-bound serine protease (ClpP class)
MQDFVVPRFEWEWTLMGRNAVVVAIGIIVSVTGIAVIALLGPKTHLFDRLTLKTQITGTAAPLKSGEETAGASGQDGYQALLGKIGVAVTTLRPVGRVEIEGEVYEAEAAGLFVEPGRGVKVVRVQGSRINVRLV